MRLLCPEVIENTLCSKNKQALSISRDRLLCNQPISIMSILSRSEVLESSDQAILLVVSMHPKSINALLHNTLRHSQLIVPISNVISNPRQRLISTPLINLQTPHLMLQSCIPRAQPLTWIPLAFITAAIRV